jgi:hypothetical protein
MSSNEEIKENKAAKLGILWINSSADEYDYTDIHIYYGVVSAALPKDSLCNACNEGSNLIICTACPHAFHADCLGMKRYDE